MRRIVGLRTLGRRLTGRPSGWRAANELGRVIAGTGLAAAIDANTLPGAQRGPTPAPIADLPQTIGVGTGPDTFSKLGDMPIGQAAPELNSPGWAKQPGEFTADHGNYASGQTLADATSVAQLQSGVAILDSSVLEVSTQHDASWKVPDAKVRVKLNVTGVGEVYLYADATDLAVGLGKPREIELRQVNADPDTAKAYRQELERTGRVIYGDQPAQQRGGRVMVAGGSATAAWNAKTAAEMGAEVDWTAEDCDPNRAPQQIDSKRRYERVQQMLNSGEITPEQAQRELAEIRAFDAAALPRNGQAGDAALNHPSIHRSVRGIRSMTPTEHIPGEPPGRVEVVFTDGTKATYDQVVVSHSTDIAAAPQPGPAGAEAERRGFLRGAREVLVESQRTEQERAYRLHHDSIRAHVATAIGAEALRGHHRAFAQPPPTAAARSGQWVTSDEQPLGHFWRASKRGGVGSPEMALLKATMDERAQRRPRRQPAQRRGDPRARRACRRDLRRRDRGPPQRRAAGRRRGVAGAYILLEADRSYVEWQARAKQQGYLR